MWYAVHYNENNTIVRWKQQQQQQNETIIIVKKINKCENTYKYIHTENVKQCVHLSKPQIKYRQTYYNNSDSDQKLLRILALMCSSAIHIYFFFVWKKSYFREKVKEKRKKKYLIAVNVIYLWVQKFNAKTFEAAAAATASIYIRTLTVILRNWVTIRILIHTVTDWHAHNVCKNMPSTFATVAQHAHHFVSFNFMRIPFSSVCSTRDVNIFWLFYYNLTTYLKLHTDAGRCIVDKRHLYTNTYIYICWYR